MLSFMYILKGGVIPDKLVTESEEEIERRYFVQRKKVKAKENSQKSFAKKCSCKGFTD